jgi:5-methylcytosine-specific restriction endonuclease McrA
MDAFSLILHHPVFALVAFLTFLVFLVWLTERPAARRRRAERFQRRIEESRRQYEERRESLRTMPYHDYLQTSEWQAIRVCKFTQAGRRCQRCWSRQKLQIHHLTYVNRGDEAMGDLEILCDACHRKEHGK